MSRTDAHAPLLVRLARGELAVKARHACHHPQCDLPTHPPFTEGEWSQTRCHWEFRYTGINVCSCWMCHAGPQHRQANRRERNRGRRMLAEASKSWRAGEESAFDDLTLPRRDRWW